MQGNSFIGYEYQDVTVRQPVASLCADGYRCFGWTLETTEYPLERLDSVTLRFKRNRQNRRQPELAQLQSQFDSCLKEVGRLEASKNHRPMVAAMSVGVVGTAFMAASVFAFVGGMAALGVVLAIPALVGWALPHFLYKRLAGRQSRQVAPLIDQKYDEIYGMCERANALVV